MKVFASKYLEAPMKEIKVSQEDWQWHPENEEAYEIYASGKSTSSNTSTYAAEKDNRSDTDRPNEGLFIA